MSVLSKKFCSPEDIQKRNSVTTNEEAEMQKYETKILQYVLTEKIDSEDLQKLLFFLLKPEFIQQIHMILYFGAFRKYRAIFVTKDKNVYSINNTEDHSKIDDKLTYTDLYLEKIKELCGKNIKTFAYSTNHTNFFILALTEEGEVYFWSKSTGYEFKDISVPSTPTQVSGLSEKHVVDIACGKYHCLALTSDGKVYGWGKNDYGQVGNGNVTPFVIVPSQVKHELDNKSVIRIACGSSFNIVLTNENKLYGWGFNMNGEVSTIGSQTYHVYPYEITGFSDQIVKIACGYEHTLALTNKGDIYAWGSNHRRQVGVNFKIRSCGPIMVNVPEMGKVLDIAAYENWNIAVGYDRIIYVWGDFFPDYYINTPFPTKFSRIYDVFISRKGRMYKPLTVFLNNYKYVDEVLNILKSLEAAFDDPLTSDLTIQVERQPIYVHKAILQIRCHYFKNMFQHYWAENIQSISNSSVYIVPDKFSYIVYKAFLKYLYTGTIDLPSENASELMELADRYCEVNLKKDCSQIIKQAVTISNVAFFHNKAIEYNAKELEEFCFQFAMRHKTEIIKLDMSTRAKFTQRIATQSRVAIMSMTSKKFCSLEDVEKRISETTNKKIKMQKYEKKIMQCILAEKIFPICLNRPIFELLKQEFMLQIHMVTIFYKFRKVINSGKNVLSRRVCIIVTKDKNVYSLSYDNEDHSQISDIHNVTCLRKIKELCGKNIKTFARGYSSILALTEEGEVYSSECAEWRSNLEQVQLTFTRVVGLIEKYIIDIACGGYHCLALTSDGKVYAWGKNSHGQLGDGNVTTIESAPKQVKHELDNKNIIGIACGSKFNMVLTNENKLYGWGSNVCGEISIIQSQKHHVYPYEIRISDQIVKVACGYTHTLALTNKGEIYAWGNNSKGQIGVNNKMKHYDPIKVNVPEMGKVLDIATYINLNAAIGYDNTVYVWGSFLHNYSFTTPFPTKFSTIHEAFARSELNVPSSVSTNDYKYIEEVLSILKSLRAVFDDPLTNDFIIKVEGRSIYVHKAILKIRCQYFKNIFQHDWAENMQSISDSSSVLTVSNKFSYIVYRAFLKYLYTGTIDLPSENALELMELADMYCETNLIKDCSQIIEKIITVSNVAFFYNKAIKYNAQELEEFCFQFALRHMAEVLLSEEYIKLDINTRDNFMRRAVKENILRI